MHDQYVNYSRLFESSADDIKRTFEKPITDAEKYLTKCESKILRDEMQKEQTKSYMAFSKSTSDPSGNADNDANLDAVKTNMVRILLSAGVFVPPHLAAEYPWDEIIRLFGDTNYNLLLIEYLRQAKERSSVTIKKLEQSLPYPVEMKELREEILGMLPKISETIKERIAIAKTNKFPQGQLIVEEEMLKMYGKLIIVSKQGKLRDVYQQRLMLPINSIVHNVGCSID